MINFKIFENTYFKVYNSCLYNEVISCNFTIAWSPFLQIQRSRVIESGIPWKFLANYFINKYSRFFSTGNNSLFIK